MDAHLQLEVVEAVASGVADPPIFSAVCSAVPSGPTLARWPPWRLKLGPDVSLLGGQVGIRLPPPPIRDRRGGRWTGFGGALQASQAVVLAGEVHWAVGESPSRRSGPQPGGRCARRRGRGDAGLLVVGRHPAGADAQLEAAA